MIRHTLDHLKCEQLGLGVECSVEHVAQPQDNNQYRLAILVIHDLISLSLLHFCFRTGLFVKLKLGQLRLK